MKTCRILRIPDGKVSVVEVDELSDTRRRVTVRVGDAKTKDSKSEVFYELVKEDSGKWVVDDLYLKQRKQGVTAYKSLTEQMNLLISVREFIDAWDVGDREKALEVAGPEFRQALDRLPPVYFAHLTRQVLGDLDSDKSFRPQAQIDDDVAIVRLPRAVGETILTLKLTKDDWHVTDVAIDAKKEEDSVISVRKQAVAVGTCTEFLEAYQRGDRDGLKKVCDKDLLRRKPRDWRPEAGSVARGSAHGSRTRSPVAVPSSRLPAPRRTRTRADRHAAGRSGRSQCTAELLRPRCDDLRTRVQAGEAALGAVHRAGDAQSLLPGPRRARPRSSAALQHARLQQPRVAAIESSHGPRIAARNLRRTAHQARFADVPGCLDSRSRVRQGGVAVTYLLRDEGGRFFVDDIQWQVSGRPTSVKQTLELMVPIKNFAAAVALGRDPGEQRAAIEILQGSCTADFNRLVWGQTDFVPNAGLSADAFLDAPLQSMSQTDDKVLVRLGDDRYGAEISMLKEHGRLLVDEIQLIAGAEPQQRVEMKTTLRNVMAQGTAMRPESMPATAPAATLAGCPATRSADAVHRTCGRPAGELHHHGCCQTASMVGRSRTASNCRLSASRRTVTRTVVGLENAALLPPAFSTCVQHTASVQSTLY